MRWTLAFVCFISAAASVSAQDWQPVTEALIVAEKPGFGKLCGIAVDHATGDVTINLSDKGFYRSTDQCKSWQKIGTPFKGRTETPGCLMLDPAGGKRLVAALVYGGPILVSGDRGESVKALDKKSQHVDWCAVDWTDPDMKFILTLKHEANDLLLVSHDGGKSFDEIGKGYGPAWIFDNKTAVVAEAKSKAKPKPGLLRTTDAGKTFEPCGEYHAKALPRWHKDTLYWVVEGALITTKDQGKSWQKISDLKDGRMGPIFGKSAEHLFILTGAGIVESSDGGKSWSKAIPAPKEMKGVSTNLRWIEYDPTQDTLYLMGMGTELYQWKRTKKLSSPKEVFDAIRMAAQKDDVRAFCQCLTEESRDLLAASVIVDEFTMMREKQKARTDKQKAHIQAVADVFKQHGLTEEFLAKLEREALIVSHPQAPLKEKVTAAKAILAPVKDRNGFITNLFETIQKVAESQAPLSLWKIAKLDEVVISGKTAEALVTMGRNKASSRFHFRRDADGWRLDLFAETPPELPPGHP